MTYVEMERPTEDVAVVRLNRPERMNSMAFDVVVPLVARLKEISAANSVRAVILTGAGHGFCSGEDQSGEKGRMPHFYLLPRAVGSSRAAEWMLTGRDIDADEAALTGLVSRVVPDDELIESCLETASAITRWSRPGVELTKRTLIDAQSAAGFEQHMHGEGLGQLLVRLLTGNFEEAVAARNEKRSPHFRD